MVRTALMIAIAAVSSGSYIYAQSHIWADVKDCTASNASRKALVLGAGPCYAFAICRDDLPPAPGHIRYKAAWIGVKTKPFACDAGVTAHNVQASSFVGGTGINGSHSVLSNWSQKYVFLAASGQPCQGIVFITAIVPYTPGNCIK